MEIEEIQTAINEAIEPLINRIDALEQKNAALEGEQKNIQATLEARIEANRRRGSCPSSSLHSWNRG
jgi:chaperonin cofactor prefoldin